MKLLTLALLASLPFAALAAWRLGGALGAGALLGYGLGLFVGLAGVRWQEHLLAVRPRLALHAFAVVFLLKLGLVIAGAFTLRFWSPAGVRADWRSYLVAFPIAVLLVTAAMSWRHFSLLKTAADPGERSAT